MINLPIADFRGNCQSSRTDGHEMYSSPLLRQAKNSIELIPLVLIMLTTLSPVLAYPNNRDTGNNNHFQAINSTVIGLRPCRPVDTEHLKMRMGFDATRMALNKEDLQKASLRERSIDDSEEEAEEEDDVGDIDDISVVDDIGNDRTSNVNSFNSNIDSISTYVSNDKSQRAGVSSADPSTSMQYMRRKRNSESFIDRKFEEEEDEDNGETDDDSEWTEYKKLMLYEHKRVKRAGKPRQRNKLPWSCGFKKNWVETSEEYFPRFYLTGKCTTKKCYYKTKQCIPKKYTIQILKRDPNRCNPLPNVGLLTEYEEVWFIERRHVIVWCECGNPRNKKRRRNKGNRRPR